MLGTPYRTGALVLTITTFVLRAYSVSRWTWTDDDWIFMHQSGSMGLGAYLFQNHHGHVAPGGLFLTWLLTRLFPLDHAAVVVVTAGLAALAVAVWAAAFKEIFGERLRLLAPLAVIALTPLAVRPTMWWAAALLHLPLQVVMGACVLVAARYARLPGTAGLLRVLVVFVVGLFCNEKALLVVAPILATVLFCSDVGFARTVRRTWPLLVALAATAVTYLFAYRFLVDSSGLRENVELDGERWLGVGGTLHFYAEALTNTLAPAVFGGPWGSTPVIGDPLAAPAPWIRAATTGALALLTVLALLLRRRAWIPVTMAVGYGAVAIALVLFSNRYLLFGAITIHDERYSLDVLVVAAFAAAMLITPARGEPSSRAFRRPAPAWLDRMGTRRVGLLLAVALATSLVVGNVQVISRNGTHPAKQWLSNLLGDVDRLGPVDLFDTRPAGRLLPPPGRDGVLSRMLSPLGDKVSFDGPAETLLVADSSGHLRNAVVESSVRALPGPVKGCGYAIQPGQPQSIPLNGRLFAWDWGMELTAYTGEPSTLLVDIDGESIEIPLAKGFARHQVGFTGPVENLRIGVVPGGAPVCVTEVDFGGVKPGARP